MTVLITILAVVFIWGSVRQTGLTTLLMLTSGAMLMCLAKALVEPLTGQVIATSVLLALADWTLFKLIRPKANRQS
jgi:hypothetical protein